MDLDRLRRCYATTREHLLSLRNDRGHWEGELSTSALSTATAVMALHLIRGSWEEDRGSQPVDPPSSILDPLITGGLAWLAAHQNPDGGWGDTTKSLSNISTSMLARAVFKATGTEDEYRDVVERAVGYIDRIGGVDAVLKRYGKDRTFSIPILTHCALAGLVEWKRVLPLPFELACIPAKFYKTVRLPVVSYALPALIAIGQVRHHFQKPWNPLTRLIRNAARKPSLRVLERIQPTNGGFLEATPLTSFVTMSLAGMGLAEHPVAKRGLEFIVNSVRDDGSWPIDTNLATWVSTLSINALGDDLPEHARPALRDWLLGQQYKEVHPYTNADPGGWAWTDLPGGVPDADDTPGAMLALASLERSAVSGQRSTASGGRQPPGYASNQESTSEVGATSETKSPETGGLTPAARRAVENGVRWLLSLQNGDGGFPTFCRGWANLPFDRSSADITAHCLRSVVDFMSTHHDFPRSAFARGTVIDWKWGPSSRDMRSRHDAVISGFRYLERVQRPDGSWYPLWFGNQFDPEEENPTYGTAKVLAAYRDCGRIETDAARRGLEWLRANQNDDGGWGGRKGIVSSVEETALATELLVSVEPEGEAAKRGVGWLMERVEGSRVEGPGSRARGGAAVPPGTRASRPPERGDGSEVSDAHDLATGDDEPPALNPQPSTLDPPSSWTAPSPIGFYFAKLWYFERLYPIAFTVGALRRAVIAYGSRPDGVTEPAFAPTPVRET